MIFIIHRREQIENPREGLRRKRLRVKMSELQSTDHIFTNKIDEEVAGANEKGVRAPQVR